MNAALRIRPRLHRLRTMRAHVPFLGALVGAVGLGSACAVTNGPDESAASETSADTVGLSTTCHQPAGCIREDRVQIVGKIQYNTTDSALAYTNPPKYKALRFTGVTGDSVDIRVHAEQGAPYAWLLDSEFGILAFSNSDPSGATKDARITMVLPST
jgi:hypothetical protein